MFTERILGRRCDYEIFWAFAIVRPSQSSQDLDQNVLHPMPCTGTYSYFQERTVKLVDIWISSKSFPADILTSFKQRLTGAPASGKLSAGLHKSHG
jgi:hypothetical protein